MMRTSTWPGLVLPDAPDLPFLERPQQLDLHARRDLADLVQQEGAPVGGLEQAGPVVAGAGEGAPHVAEQLALQERSR